MIGPIFDEIDADGTRTVSKKEFEQLAVNPAVVEAFREVGLDADHVVALADTLFEPEENAETVKSRATMKMQHHGGERERTESDQSAEGQSKELGFEEFLEL